MFESRSVSARLYSVRAPIPIALALVLAGGAPPAVRGENDPGAVPCQIHLGSAGDPATGVIVSWKTASPIDGATVRYGIDRQNLDRIVPAVSFRSPYQEEGWLHEARLTDLPAGTRYFYRVGRVAGPWSDPLEFRTAPSPGERTPIQFMVIGDQGVTPEAHRVAEMASRMNPDFILHVGDISYANGRPAIWDQWFEMMEPLTRGRILFPAIGNHEYERVLGLTNYLQRFALPGNEEWYSFDWGTLHVVSIDTDAEGDAAVEQYKWAQADLAAADANPDVHWIVVVLHRPPYSAGEHGGSEMVRTLYSPLFEQHRVDVVFCGHEHSYERLYPLVQGEVTSECDDCVDPRGPIHVVTGGGGMSLRPVAGNQWTAHAEAVYEVCWVTIGKNGVLRLEARALAEPEGRSDYRVIDRLTIRKTGWDGGIGGN